VSEPETIRPHARDTGDARPWAGVTDEKRVAFLVQLSNTANVRRACEAAGISRPTAYRWREADPDFAEQWDAALECAHDLVEEGVFKSGLKGGEDGRFWLKSHRRDKYGDRASLDLTSGGKSFADVLAKLRVRKEARARKAQEAQGGADPTGG